MTDYSKTAARADQSLRRKGGIVVLRQVVTGPYDPDLGTAPITTTDCEGTGVKINYEAENIDGTLIQAGDQKLLLSPLQRNGAPMPMPTTWMMPVHTTKPTVKAAGSLARGASTPCG